MSVIEKLLSEKEKPMIVHAGYIYTQERATSTKLIFRCQNRNCKGVGRKKPLFDHKLWNIYDRAVANLPRFNNTAEGWHNVFATRVAISHPTVAKLTEKIRLEQSKFEIDIAQIFKGHEPKPKKACYHKRDELISRMVLGYDQSQIDQYLKNISPNI